MNCVIKTFTGKTVNPLDLLYHEIDIKDIAHALSLCNRFAGHTIRPISVAQHSVYVSRLCDGTGDELQALLHDASEAYLGDVTKWLKHTPEMEAFRHAEDSVQSAIFIRYGCKRLESPYVDIADRIMVRYEGVKGFPGSEFKIDHPDYPPLTKEEIEKVGKWGFWTHKVAEESFLDRYCALSNR